MDLNALSEREYWAEVARRPAMWIGQTTLTGVEAFLEGYHQHSLRHSGRGLSGWRDWLMDRPGLYCSHARPGQVRHLALPHGWVVGSFALVAKAERVAGGVGVHGAAATLRR